MSTKQKSKRARIHAIAPVHELNEIRIIELRDWIRCALNWGCAIGQTSSREACMTRIETIFGILEMALEIDDAYFARIRKKPLSTKLVEGGVK